MHIKLQFLGGAGTVTGSKFLLTIDNYKILIDCGLFQGLKNLRLKNWDTLPVDPSTIDAVILTHAHIDHSGFIPRLVQQGFSGPIYSTHATWDLCKILLPDSGYLMEEEANYLNRTNLSKHKPALPLFTIQQAENSLRNFKTVSFNQFTNLAPKIGFEFLYAGHILGAASIVITAGDKKIAFTGDIGRMEDKIFYEPEQLPPIDYLITESTYGDRLHPQNDVLDDFAFAINEANSKSGVIMIPAFAIGRSISMIHALYLLTKSKRIPRLPIYLNSPMATSFSELFFMYKDLHKLTDDECREMEQMVQFVRTQDESIELNLKKGPMLIISASGMITGGRILHHLKAFAPDERNMIILTGYQAPGTRGEALEKGEKQLKIHGDYVDIRASVKMLNGLSAHADYNEIIGWLTKSKIHPKKTFIVHGDPSSSDSFRLKLKDQLGWDCVTPEHLQSFDLE